MWRLPRSARRRSFRTTRRERIRLLAQSTAARSPSLPDVPTYQEAGIKGLVLDQWLGVLVPAGTPPAIVARLNLEMNKALADATVRDSFLQSAQEPIGGTADAFGRLCASASTTGQRAYQEQLSGAGAVKRELEYQAASPLRETEQDARNVNPRSRRRP